MKVHISCSHCSHIIFDGEEFLLDDFFKKVFCSDDCCMENFSDEIEKMYDVHKQFHVIIQDKLS